MTTIYYEDDGDLGAIAGERIAVVGYGNQGRSWALNLRDSGCPPTDLRARRRDTRAGRSRTASTRRTSRARVTRTSSASSFPTTSWHCCRSRHARMPAWSWRVATHSRSDASSRPATRSWSHRGCSDPKCGSATRRASGSSPRSACTRTRPSRAAGPDAGGRPCDRRVAPGRNRDDADPGSDPRPRRRAGPLARARRPSTPRSYRR